jgi:hypothetical protein
MYAQFGLAPEISESTYYVKSEGVCIPTTFRSWRSPPKSPSGQPTSPLTFQPVSFWGQATALSREVSAYQQRSEVESHHQKPTRIANIPAENWTGQLSSSTGQKRYHWSQINHLHRTCEYSICGRVCVHYACMKHTVRNWYYVFGDLRFSWRFPKNQVFRNVTKFLRSMVASRPYQMSATIYQWIQYNIQQNFTLRLSRFDAI